MGEHIDSLKGLFVGENEVGGDVERGEKEEEENL